MATERGALAQQSGNVRCACVSGRAGVDECRRRHAMDGHGHVHAHEHERLHAMWRLNLGPAAAPPAT